MQPPPSPPKIIVMRPLKKKPLKLLIPEIFSKNGGKKLTPLAQNLPILKKITTLK